MIQIQYKYYIVKHRFKAMVIAATRCVHTRIILVNEVTLTREPCYTQNSLIVIVSL